MKAKAATRRWAKEVGLDITGKPTWAIQVVLMTTGKVPPNILPRHPTCFVLSVSDGWWSITLDHKSLTFGWQDSTEEGPRYSYTNWKQLEPPKSLADVFQWLAKQEALIGKKFCRDRPSIQSNVKGGAKATREWLIALP